MARILTENLVTPCCRFCNTPVHISQFAFDEAGGMWGISFCKRCEILIWQNYPIEKIMADVISAQNGKQKPGSEEKRGMDNGYL